MGFFAVPIEKLIEEFERLPGIGHKMAERLALHVVNLSDDKIKKFSNTILDAKSKTTYCSLCNNLTEVNPCNLCTEEKREKSMICVVENPRDVVAMEKTKEYNGIYHVLHGAISPMNGIGPDDIKIKELLIRINENNTREVILATNPNLEGEATAMYIAKLIKPLGVKATRIAYGIPIGSSLEYADEITLIKALEGRREI